MSLHRPLLIGVAFFSFSVGAAAPAPLPAYAVKSPPPVQVLVPGFSVRELPVQLRNLNNLVYAPDGRLFALGYDGNVYQLTDTDGDGLEDRATLFFDNTSGAIPPSIGMAWGPGGLYLASRGRVIHLKDKGDGTSELQTVTGGWLPPTIAAGSNLDAIGLAVDPAGNIYFGLGADAWRSAYRVDPKTGVSDYNVHSERGTIIRLSPDWKRDGFGFGVEDRRELDVYYSPARGDHPDLVLMMLPNPAGGGCGYRRVTTPDGHEFCVAPDPRNLYASWYLSGTTFNLIVRHESDSSAEKAAAAVVDADWKAADSSAASATSTP